MNEGAVITYEEPKPLTASDIRANVNLIQEVMRSVMQQGQHYGKIPGAGDKPTLLKPGAEKIMATFRLSADPEVSDMSERDMIRYRVKVRLISPSGRMVGAGVGECSSEEEKYKWRKSVSEKEFENTTEPHRRIKYRYDKEEKQVRTNPYDLANTILKMAKKRALVDAVLTATAASDIFTQDIEDLPEEVLDRKKDTSHTPPPENKPHETSGNGAVISEAQAKRFYAIAKGAGWQDAELKEWLKENYHIDSTKKILKSQYDNMIQEVQAGEGTNG